MCAINIAHLLEEVEPWWLAHSTCPDCFEASSNSPNTSRDLPHVRLVQARVRDEDVVDVAPKISYTVRFGLEERKGVRS